MMQKVSVRDRMSGALITIAPDTPVLVAYDLMRRREVRRLPVVEGAARLIGMLTRSDVERAMPMAHSNEGRIEALFALAGRQVDELMARELITLSPDQSIADAAAAMIRHKVSGLPVVEEGQIVGLITESDIFRLVVEAWGEHG
jgi:acetoin utilization protein AcuB